MRWTRGFSIAAALAAVLGLVITGAWIGRGEPVSRALEQRTSAPLPTGRAGLLPESARGRVDQLARGAMIHVLLHQAAHMLIAELNIPATGPAEDVADEVASFLASDLLLAASDERRQSVADAMWSGIEFWRLLAGGAAGPEQRTTWFAGHVPDMRRYYAQMCLAAGADPQRFMPLAAKSGVPHERLHACAETYQAKRGVWEVLTREHQRGWWQSVSGGHRLAMQVVPGSAAGAPAIEASIGRSGLLLDLLDSISAAVALPRDIAVVLRECPRPEVSWKPADATITICEGFVEKVAETFAVAELEVRARASLPPSAAGDRGEPAASLDASGSHVPGEGATPANQSMAGMWFCLGNVGGLRSQEQLELAPDGQYRSSIQYPATGNSLLSWGAWREQRGVLRLDVAGTSPPTRVESPRLMPLRATGPNAFRSLTGACQRVAP